MPNTKNQIAWAAGLFEGEGCIVASSEGNNGYARVQLVLGTTDLDVLQRFQKTVRVGLIHSREVRSEAHRDFWVWQISGRKAKSVLEMFLPYLGERRTAKARFALELVASLKMPSSERTHCPSGHEYSSDNTYLNPRGFRQCRECSREYQRKRGAYAQH